MIWAFAHRLVGKPGWSVSQPSLDEDYFERRLDLNNLVLQKEAILFAWVKHIDYMRCLAACFP